IAANGYPGVVISGLSVPNPSNNVIQGNYVGTDVTGTRPLGNLNGGVAVNAGTNTRVGGPVPTQPGACVSLCNVIASTGVSHDPHLGPCAINVTLNGPSQGGVVQGNHIGTDVNGKDNLGNFGDGVHVLDSSSNTIGGTAVGAGNTIAFNFAGVVIETHGGTAVSNGILGNSIHHNEDLGIDLAPGFHVTPNDAFDNDPGSNDLQNFPELSAVKLTSTGLRVEGKLRSLVHG